MYLSEMHYLNVGPIKEIHHTFRINSNGTPVPLVIVGENGSGKSILLSNIVDAFYEFAVKKFNNAMKYDDAGGYSYYKMIRPSDIRIGNDFMISYLSFSQGDKKLEYLMKSGELDFSKFTINNVKLNSSLDWKLQNNFKKVIVDDVIFEAFESEIAVFFGPERFQEPGWIGGSYPKKPSFSFKKNISRILKNPIYAENNPDAKMQWLMDIIMDSRADLAKKADGTGYTIAFPTIQIIDRLSVARNNIEELLSAILGESIVLVASNRSENDKRLQIFSKTEKQTRVASIKDLSTGQAILFNLFSTIIEYADKNNISLSYNLSQIRGIVVIDEIEMHLHPSMQAELLPRLINLFPQVQFIITSHSPLFLLGMQKEFRDTGFDILQLPSGGSILPEDFSQFRKAFSYITETKAFTDKLEYAIRNGKKPLLITEGPTDWKHIKAAFSYLKSTKEKFANLDFDLFEYSEADQSDTKQKCRMGNSELLKMCEACSRVNYGRILIFIADNDDQRYIKDFEKNGKPKAWGNSVFSLCLTVPAHRSETPEICIEHLYQDTDLKKEFICDDGKPARLFFNSEFANHNFHIADDYVLSRELQRNASPIGLIDGSSGFKVYKKDNPMHNYALSKNKFADLVLTKVPPFESMDFSGFIPLFDAIDEIIDGNIISESR